MELRTEEVEISPRKADRNRAKTEWDEKLTCDNWEQKIPGTDTLKVDKA